MEWNFDKKMAQDLKGSQVKKKKISYLEELEYRQGGNLKTVSVQKQYDHKIQ